MTDIDRETIEELRENRDRLERLAESGLPIAPDADRLLDWLDSIES